MTTNHIVKPTAFLLHGFLGSGKTTLAKQLEKQQDALRFTHDEWMVRLYGNDPPADVFPDYARRVFSQIEEVWTRCLTLKINVILDFGFWSRAERDYVRGRVAAHGGTAVLYSLFCPEGLAWARIEQRNHQPGNLFISKNTFDLLKKRFHPLDPAEERIVVPAENSNPMT